MNRLKGDVPKKMPWEKRDVKKNGWTHASQSGFYNTSRWKKLRNFIIKNEPLCRECLTQGRMIPAYVVDHIIPVDDAPDLAYDEENLQPLCSRCHRVKTNRDSGKNSELNRKRGRDLMKKFDFD